MNQSTVVKTTSGVTTKTTTTKTTMQSSTQRHQQQEVKTQQKVMAKPPQVGASKTKNSVEEKTTKEAAKENFASTRSRMEDVCVRCHRTVYKMEEVIAEDQVWHKNCFRCKQCEKPLNRYNKVDSYQLHEGVPYCKFHFKQLFGPKEEEAQKRKPELIIRENQPVELPDGVVRSSDKRELGFEDIQSAAVKSRFQMFEKISTTKEEVEESQPRRGIKRSATVLSKMKKFHAKGMDVGITADDLRNNVDKNDLKEDLDDDDSIHSEDYDDSTDVDLIRAKRAQRERPFSFDNMSDIKHKFETGMEQAREERHKERKQEIQNIRSKLFMGKQARTKEMYENAVADLETTKLRNKGRHTAHELDNVKATAESMRKIKQKFETGDLYRKSIDPDVDTAKVKEQGAGQISNKVSERMQLLAKQQAQDKIVKNSAKVKNVEIADISTQFEFFENYNPEERKSKASRVTPPKEATDDEDNEKAQNGIKLDGLKIDVLTVSGIVQRAKSTYIETVKKTKTSNRKRGIENVVGRQKLAPSNQDLIENQSIPEELNSEGNEIPSRKPGYLDSDLEQARKAARTRDLKDRFEKWNYENNVCNVAVYNDSIPEYDEIDDSQTESTRAIRAKFERLPQLKQMQRSSQPKVNRFV